MKGHIWRRLAVVAALTAALLSGTPSSQAAETIFSLPDTYGDAHAGTSLCSIECGGLPTPVSEPSLDVRQVRLDRVGGDLVVEWKVVDLDHVPVPAQPDDIAGYQFHFRVDDVSIMVLAWRTAAHAPLESVVSAGSYADDARRPIAASFDHGADTVRATVPLAVLNDAVDDVCGTCHVDNGSTFTHPFDMTFLLATTPGGWTGPVYQDLTREKQLGPVVPTEQGLPTSYFGGGPFTATITYHPPTPECGDWGNRPATLSITANVALSKGTAHYVGPVTIEGSGCGQGGTIHFPQGTAHGTDVNGRTLDCPGMGGLIVNVTPTWTGSMGGDSCTLDGVALRLVNPFVMGHFVPTGIGADLQVSSGTATGVMTISAYER